MRSPRRTPPEAAPNRSPAERVRFGKEEQQNERALILIKNQSKRYDACSDVVEEVDSNHRSETQQIYSLPPLATRELLHMKLLELVDGLEPRPADYKSAALQLSYTSVSALSSSTTLLIISGKGRVVNRKSKKISKNFERAEWASKGQERKHEREDFYRSAAGCAAGTGGGLVQALPAGDLRLGAGGGGGPVSPVPGGGKTRGNGAKQGDT